MYSMYVCMYSMYVCMFSMYCIRFNFHGVYISQISAFSDFRIFSFADDRVLPLPDLNFRRCKLSQMASNLQIPQILNPANIEVHTVCMYMFVFTIAACMSDGLIRLGSLI